MKIAEQIERLLRDQYDKGATYQDLANKYNITNQAVSKWFSKTQPIDNISLRTIQKMFPNATINFDGAQNQITQTSTQGTTIAVTGNNAKNKVISGPVEPSAKCDICSKILDAIMSSDLDDTSKVKVYKIIKES